MLNVNAITQQQMNDRKDNIYWKNPHRLEGCHEYDYKEHALRPTENVAIVNNLMLEQVLKNQEKIMNKLDIEA